MRRYWFAGLLCLLSAFPAFGQGLVLEGDVKVIKVDKVVTTIVKEDRTVVNSLPFTVKAPEGAGLYFWSFPATITATDMGDSLRVTSAPKGEAVISVKMITADVQGEKFKGFITKFLTVPFVVGDVIPPSPVDPVLTPLQKMLKETLDSDTDPNKMVSASKFGDILLSLVPTARMATKLGPDGKTLVPAIATAKDLVILGKSSTDIAIGPTAIPKTRKAVGSYLSLVLPKEADAPADDAYWTAADREHKIVGTALKGLVK